MGVRDERPDRICLSGNVRSAVRGDPKGIGICHCADCRQESGSAFTYFAIWPADQFDADADSVWSADRACTPRTRS